MQAMSLPPDPLMDLAGAKAPRSFAKLRPMTLDDLDAVHNIEQRIFPFPWSLANFSDSLAAGYATTILDLGGNIAGYLVWMQIVDEAHLLNISVDAAYQRGGWGRWLMQQLSDAASQAGCVSLLLEVRPSNIAALQLYQQVGFERIGLRKRYYPSLDGAREDAIVMRAELPLQAPGAER